MKRQHWRNIYNAMDKLIQIAAPMSIDSRQKEVIINFVKLIMISKDIRWSYQWFKNHDIWHREDVNEQASILFKCSCDEYDEWFDEPEKSCLHCNRKFPAIEIGNPYLFDFRARFENLHNCPQLDWYITHYLVGSGQSIIGGTEEQRRFEYHIYMSLVSDWIFSRDGIARGLGLYRMFSITDPDEAHNLFRNEWIPFFISELG